MKYHPSELPIEETKAIYQKHIPAIDAAYKAAEAAKEAASAAYKPVFLNYLLKREETAQGIADAAAYAVAKAAKEATIAALYAAYDAQSSEIRKAIAAKRKADRIALKEFLKTNRA
jgi:hypothetical protein